MCPEVRLKATVLQKINILRIHVLLFTVDNILQSFTNHMHFTTFRSSVYFILYKTFINFIKVKEAGWSTHYPYGIP